MGPQRAAKLIRSRKRTRGRPTIPFLRETVLRQASELFGSHDFAMVSVDQVALRAGVGKGSIYRQFGSKEELYAAVVIDGFERLQNEIRGALSGSTSTRDQIRDRRAAHAEDLLVAPPILRALARSDRASGESGAKLSQTAPRTFEND